jgi:hypothetical protein
VCVCGVCRCVFFVWCVYVCVCLCGVCVGVCVRVVCMFV